MTHDNAIKAAIKAYNAAIKSRGEWTDQDRIYVVFDDGTYQVASEYDLDTFFNGIRDNAIMFCAAD